MDAEREHAQRRMGWTWSSWVEVGGGGSAGGPRACEPVWRSSRAPRIQTGTGDLEQQTRRRHVMYPINWFIVEQTEDIP